jgi:uncharacterized membrane protein
MSRTAAVAVVAIAGLCLLTASTGGFTAVSGTSPMDVSVVTPDRAYVDVEPTDPVVDTNRTATVAVATVTNRLSTPITRVSVRVRDGAPPEPSLRDREVPTRLSPGESDEIRFAVTCGPDEAVETWRVAVTATGPDVSFETTFSVAVNCRRPPE